MQRYGSEKAGIAATKFGRASAVRTAAITQAMGRTVPTVIVRGAHPLTHHGSGAINSPYNPLACGASITVHRALTLSAMPVYQGSGTMKCARYEMCTDAARIVGQTSHQELIRRTGSHCRLTSWNAGPQRHGCVHIQ